MICSVLNYDGRAINKLLSLFLSGLRTLRKGEGLGIRDLPWLRCGGKPNIRLFQKGQPTVHWFTRKEICYRLKNCGYKIIEEYKDSKSPSILYFACEK